MNLLKRVVSCQKKKSSHRVSLFKDVTDSLSYRCTEESRRPENPFEGSSLMHSTFFFFLLLLCIICNHSSQSWPPVAEQTPAWRVHTSVCSRLHVHRLRVDAWPVTEKTGSNEYFTWGLDCTVRSSSLTAAGKNWHAARLVHVSYVCERGAEQEKTHWDLRAVSHACLPTLLNHAVGMKMEQKNDRGRGKSYRVMKKRFYRGREGVIFVEYEISSGTGE